MCPKAPSSLNKTSINDEVSVNDDVHETGREILVTEWDGAGHGEANDMPTCTASGLKRRQNLVRPPYSLYFCQKTRLNQRRAGWPVGPYRGAEHHGHPEVKTPREKNKRHTERSPRGISRVDERPRKPCRKSNTHHQCPGRFLERAQHQMNCSSSLHAWSGGFPRGKEGVYSCLGQVTL